jgi:ribosomal protein S18 acetylase RimI-like enzyme
MVSLDEVCFAAELRFSRSLMRRYAEARDALALVIGAGDGRGDDELTGFVIVQIEQDETAEKLGYVVTLDVAPASRRTGVAATLMREVERQALATGAVRMLLHVSVQNEPAIRFYATQAYRQIGLEPEFYGGPGMDAYLYGKGLGDGRGSE